ncbi:MAG: Glucosamine-6-phosphate deaminase [Planctomycetes bacterium ADurb.Bin126]|nr:MAG: Glucosamine-6-phosphate deaminase [Planctomycetes bacterium ADurb.Bin126]
MGLASAISLAAEQCHLVSARGTASMLLMAAPSAFAFYQAYVRLARSCVTLRSAIAATHFFQFDDYCLPFHHPASFRFLLCKRFLFHFADLYDATRVHLFPADATNIEDAAARYGDLIMEHGPDLQLKGIGENGHWGFHEPGLPLTGEPCFGCVTLTEENVAQQMRDHPCIFAGRAAVPRFAYTANVPLFMRTRTLIEDNVPQASKAFALLAAYGTDTVDPCVPSSMLKRHPRAVLRTTKAAAWALLEFRETGVVSEEMLLQLADSVPDRETNRQHTAEHMRSVLERMQITCL